MAWFPDLAACNCFGEEVSPYMRAVGWLERSKPFPTGSVDRAVYVRLLELRQDPWQPMVSPGIHFCDLCLYDGEQSGDKNVFIPGPESLYVAPELIVHYMNAHGYAPPAEFCEAVLACPPMRSMEYFKAIRQCAPWLRKGPRPE